MRNIFKRKPPVDDANIIEREKKLGKIFVTNRGSIEHGKILDEFGIVSGSVAPSRFITKDILASIRNVFGREMKEYTSMINDAREVATNRMMEHAMKLDANAVVNVRYMGTGISAGSAEMMAYGTAVRYQPI